MLIANIKRINLNTKDLVIASEEDEESKKINNIYEYGADEIVLIPSSPTDISDKILLMVSQRNILENPTNDLV